MRWCVGITVAAVLFGFGVTFGQERSDKPGGEKPAKPEFKPPFFGRGPGFGGFTPPANREEAIQRVRQQLERAREMVKQLEGMLSRLEAEQRAGDARREEARRESRPGDKPPAARETRPDSDRRDGKPEARRPEKPPFRKPEPRRDDHARRPAPPPQFPGRFGWWGRGRFGPGWGRWTPPGWGRWGMPGWGRWAPPAPRFGRFGPPAWQRGWAPGQPGWRGPERFRRDSDLEARLDRIARELEEIRRELRQRR
jgi:hypothetical protein